LGDLRSQFETNFFGLIGESLRIYTDGEKYMLIGLRSLRYSFGKWNLKMTNTSTNITADNAPLPTLDSQAAESIVFRRDNTKDIFHKRIVSRDIITNRRIIHTTDYNKDSPQIWFQDIDDVLSMNRSLDQMSQQLMHLMDLSSNCKLLSTYNSLM
jgi:hypothetical protein